MKIEKLNDNQIRCTLTRADLADRQLKLSELAYGTDKAKSLFQDMMRQASFEFGFEANDIPLMIEAIPSTADSIILVITKVEDPEELDTRFSKFAPLGDSDEKRNTTLEKLEGAEEFLDLLNKVKESVTKLGDSVKEDAPAVNVRLFSFTNIDSVITVAHMLKSMYFGSNTLYKDNTNDTFVLALTQSNHTNSDFNKLCNMLSEYGTLEKASSATLAYLEEHCDVIVSTDATQQLASI
ncbi:MAG: adaptor protein MecA [Lachnospiraceae bacterium]|nr:adaptor protein MecA [Lachnospiraceae bacterium]